MDEHERRELERYRQDRRDQQNRERISGQLETAETRKQAVLEKAHIDQQTKLQLAGASIEQLQLLHTQSIENRDLDYQDYVRSENVRLQSLQVQLDIERADYLARAETDTNNATTLIKESLKAEIMKKIIDKVLSGGVESLSKEQRDFLQEQARQDLGL